MVICSQVQLQLQMQLQVQQEQQHSRLLQPPLLLLMLLGVFRCREGRAANCAYSLDS